MRPTPLAIATAPALFVLLWSTGFIGARYVSFPKIPSDPDSHRKTESSHH
jgi:hypothetical protein